MPRKPNPAHGPAKGAGWGGPAKGAGRGGAAKAFTKDSETAVPFPGGRTDPTEASQRRRKLAADKAERIEQLIEHLGDLALNAEREETQISAAIAALNRLDGMPVAKQINVNTEMSFEDMVRAAQQPK